MNNKVIIVSAPDDIVENGCRLLLVDLTPDQSKIVSDSILGVTGHYPLIVYNWNITDDDQWLFDKIYKSYTIIFNADCFNQTLIGFLASRPNSYYFGHLKSINQINKNAIWDSNQCNNIIANIFSEHGT